MKRLIPLLLTVVLLAAACGDDASSTDVGGPDASTTTIDTTTTSGVDETTPRGMLEAARQRWADKGLASYRLTTAEICFCPETFWINTIVDGVVTSHEPLGEESSFFDPGPRAMETLFDEIAEAITRGYETLDVEYHPETGAVVSYYVDVEANVADEEYGVTVTALTPYDPAAPEPEVSAAALVDDYGCGYAFYKGAADQTLKLAITWDAGFAADAPAVTGPVTLPDDGWRARIATGADLFSNHCDDVIEPDEPEPVTTSVWMITEGTLTITSETPLTTEGGQVVTATLTGAVAESGNGTRVELDDVALRNTCWGCFAG